MKTLILAVAMGSMACGGLAQGRFIFSNRSAICTPLVDAKHLSISANPATLTMEGPRQVQVWFSLESCRLSTSGEPDQVRLEWTPRAVLEARDALMPGDWRDVSAAASPYDVEPASAQGFYRLRRPRRVRCGRTGSGPREASGVRRFTGAFCRNDPPKAALKRTHSTRSATSPAGDGPLPLPPRRESAPSRHRRTPLEAGRSFCPLARLLTLLAGTASLVVAEAAAPGQVLWTFTTGGYVESSPAIGTDGTVYVGSRDR